MDKVKAFLMYWFNIFIWNKEGWYLRGGDPTPEAQSFIVMTGRKPYTLRTCKVCKEKFWSRSKADTCIRIKCYVKWRTHAYNTCKN